MLASGFRWLSRMRSKRVFHPQGVAFSGSWRTDDRDALAGLPADDLDAVVRLSRAVGLPEPSPDILGVAIKVLDAGGPGRDLDLLLASTGSGAVGRRVLAPARDFTAARFSSILPHAMADGREGPLTAVVDHQLPGDGAVSFARLQDAATAALTIDLAVGDGRPIASVSVSDRLDDSIAADLRFDPSHDGGPMRPVGALNRLRMPVYSASQDGRGAPVTGARRRLVAALRDDERTAKRDSGENALGPSS